MRGCQYCIEVDADLDAMTRERDELRERVEELTIEIESHRKEVGTSYCKQIFCDHYQKDCVILSARDAEIERLEAVIENIDEALHMRWNDKKDMFRHIDRLIDGANEGKENKRLRHETIKCYCCQTETLEADLVEGHRCPKCKCSIGVDWVYEK